MTTPPSSAAGGGFIPPPRRPPTTTLPSPAPSSASARAAAGLPRPRTKPLVPGSKKEDYARAYVSQRLLHINRRFFKHFSLPDDRDQVSGYPDFSQACRDLDEVVDVLWVSATPAFQVPNLLNVVLAITEYLPSFPPAPHETFALLRKLDHCCASLLVGRDVRTSVPLPGFENGRTRGFTRTDMVRLKSLAEETRSLVATHMSRVAEVDTFLPEGNEDGLYAPIENKAVNRRSSASPKRKRRLEDGEDEEGNTYTGSTERMKSATPPKRRKTVSPEGIRGQKSHATSPSFSHNHSSPKTSANKTKSATNGDGDGAGEKQQFHWALDEDSDVEGNELQKKTHVLPHERMQIREEEDEVDDDDDDDDDDDAGEDRGHEDEEEDEELYMAVAKVYEKTIVKLNEVLGEAIVDDRALREGTRCDVNGTAST